MITYLNSNSTDYLNTNTFNPSDVGFPQVIQMLDEWKEYVEEVKRYVNAQDSSRVVIVSGASEAVATCMNWTRTSFGTGRKVYGTTLDHDVIIENTKLYRLKYVQDDDISSDAAAIFITLVDPKTGEIYDLDKFERNYSRLQHTPNSITPLVFMDVSQAITKIPIDMSRYNVNCLFFSLHKLGGEIGTGIMIVNDTKSTPFVPLIAGHQQSGLRGGTYPLAEVLRCKFYKEKHNDIESRKKKWEYGYKTLIKEGVDVYKPQRPHTYNTYLINIGKMCPLVVINALAEIYNIYVGTSSACKGEEIMRKENIDSYIRISFKEGDDISKDVLHKIAAIIDAVKKNKV